MAVGVVMDGCGDVMVIWWWEWYGCGGGGVWW